MDRIELRGMAFDGRHGASPKEQDTPQRFVVDLEVECDVATPGHSDRLADAVDYRALRSIARDVIEGRSVNLIETLATEIAERALRLDGVAAVTVRVAKRPPSMEPIDAAAVRINRTRA